MNLFLGGDCANPEMPGGGATMNCESYGPSSVQDLYRGCSISCPSGSGFLEPVPLIYTCGVQGVWNAQDTTTAFRFPACGGL